MARDYGVVVEHSTPLQRKNNLNHVDPNSKEIDGISMSGHRVFDNSGHQQAQYGMLVLDTHGAWHLTPVDAVIECRPDLSYIDLQGETTSQILNSGYQSTDDELAADESDMDLPPAEEAMQ